ncbi:hypothetical protein M0811_00830 [Anaeramoeba ignava]|uniref:Uncharacterized protein n=1 Tax=Anaeramoeba ignava TaxID=1746090 RepID=A0A9Q0RBH9_ANAIG|nr:hypothetical protein M0811_00830 [Anaeramoeba ignava]
MKHSHIIIVLFAILLILSADALALASLITQGLFYIKDKAGIYSNFNFGDFFSDCSGPNCTKTKEALCDWSADVNFFKSTIGNGLLSVASFFLFLNSLFLLKSTPDFSFFLALFGSIFIISGYGSFKIYFKDSDEYSWLEFASNSHLITWDFGSNLPIQVLSFVLGILGSVFILMIWRRKVKKSNQRYFKF